MPSVELLGRAEVERALRLAGPTIVARFLDALERQGFELAQYIKTEELSGQILHNRTGTLRRSIAMTPHRSQGFVDVGTNVVYARVHEFGAVIRAKNAPFLKFQVGGKWVQKKQVLAPARPFMRPALIRNRGHIQAALATAVRMAVREVVP